jgi:sugar O-acyltransferase (sialic acid O-acetyltransferase NeuD family)
MTALIIIGAGGHAKAVADLAKTLRWDISCFVDTVNPHRAGEVFQGAEIVSTLPEPLPGSAVAVAIGDCAARLMWVQRLMAEGWQLPVLLHPSAVISASGTIGAGSVVMAQAVVHTDAVLGVGVLVNTAAVVEHDCHLGDGVHMAPRSCLCGQIRVGSQTMIGAGTVIRENLRIGARTVVGAGSVVVKDLPDDVTAWGVPAKIMRTH